MKVATAAYPLSFFSAWSEFEFKLTSWTAEAVTQGADLLVFPEYGAMELASLQGVEMSTREQGGIDAVNMHIAAFYDLHARLAANHGVHILAGSAPIREGGRTVNRAALFAPDGSMDWQDKQIMTRFERDGWGIAGGGPLKLFETTLGKIGILICYDSEFPVLARVLAEAGAEILLVPSCTEQLEGYWRVRIGAMARALENQCVTVMASLVGMQENLYGVEENTGMGGVFGPPDRGFPGTGVMAEGVLNQPGWTYADVDLAKVAEVRADGNVLNLTHWQEQLPRATKVTSVRLG